MCSVNNFAHKVVIKLVAERLRRGYSWRMRQAGIRRRYLALTIVPLASDAPLPATSITCLTSG